ncbi:MAG TPA: hypothetical protein VGG28_04385 [Kofleriaceae bacterium]
MKDRIPMAERALGEAAGGSAIAGAAAMAGVAAPIAIALVALPDSAATTAIAGVACVVIPLVSYRLAVRLLANRRMRELRRLGHGFELEPYLAALRVQRDIAFVIARVSFAGATKPALPANARWDGDTLVIRSDAINGRWNGRRGIEYSNARLHGAFLAIVRRVLPQLGPIASLRVEIANARPDIHGA